MEATVLGTDPNGYISRSQIRFPFWYPKILGADM